MINKIILIKKQKRINNSLEDMDLCFQNSNDYSIKIINNEVLQNFKIIKFKNLIFKTSNFI